MNKIVRGVPSSFNSHLTNKPEEPSVPSAAPGIRAGYPGVSFAIRKALCQAVMRVGGAHVLAHLGCKARLGCFSLKCGFLVGNLCDSF